MPISNEASNPSRIGMEGEVSQKGRQPCGSESTCHTLPAWQTSTTSA